MMTKNGPPKTGAIDAAIARHLPRAIETMRGAGREPYTYVLLIERAKDGTEESILIPGEEIDQVMRDPRRWEALARYVEIQTGFDDLLVVVSDGDEHVAEWIAVQAATAGADRVSDA